MGGCLMTSRRKGRKVLQAAFADISAQLRQEDLAQASANEDFTGKVSSYKLALMECVTQAKWKLIVEKSDERDLATIEDVLHVKELLSLCGYSCRVCVDIDGVIRLF